MLSFVVVLTSVICYLFPSSASMFNPSMCFLGSSVFFSSMVLPNPLPTTYLLVEGVSELVPVIFSSDFGTSKEFLCEVQFPPTPGWGPVFLDPLCGIAVYWPEIAGDMSGICFRY